MIKIQKMNDQLILCEKLKADKNITSLRELSTGSLYDQYILLFPPHYYYFFSFLSEISAGRSVLDETVNKFLTTVARTQ